MGKKDAYRFHVNMKQINGMIEGKLTHFGTLTSK